MRDEPQGPVFGILSTYPPTACGLATFSAALAAGFSGRGRDVRVVQIADGTPSPSPFLAGELVNGSPSSLAAAVHVLDGCDIAVVQHEYGIFGGSDGDEVLEILDRLSVPSIVVAHTVPLAPTPHQRAVLRDVVALADRVVVMSEAARSRLAAFDIDLDKVATIQHGATVPSPSERRPGGPPLLTWGLLGPGKGVERVIDALPDLDDLGRRAHYRIAGQTHPKVLANDGEAYRHSCMRRSWRLGVAARVAFDDAYRDVPSLTRLVHSAGVVVLPYDSTDQVTSGVLVDAIAAGRPVVATAFPHAVELLGSGAGIVVDHDDHDGLVRALRRALSDPAAGAAMAAEAARLAPSLGWPVVAAAYEQLADELLAGRVAAA